MNIQAEKLDLIQWLAKVNDINIVRQFMLLKESSQEMASGKLTTAEKQAIDEGLDSIKKGNAKSHEEVVRDTKKKYSQRFTQSDPWK